MNVAGHATFPDAWSYLEREGLWQVANAIEHGNETDAFPPQVLRRWAEMQHLVTHMCMVARLRHSMDRMLDTFGTMTTKFITVFVLEKLDGLTGEALLRDMSMRWRQLEGVAEWMKTTFTAFDEHWRKENSRVDVKAFVIAWFGFLAKDSLLPRVQAAALHVVNLERSGVIERSRDLSTFAGLLETLEEHMPGSLLDPWGDEYMAAMVEYYGEREEVGGGEEDFKDFLSLPEQVHEAEFHRAVKYTVPKVLELIRGASCFEDRSPS